MERFHCMCMYDSMLVCASAQELECACICMYDGIYSGAQKKVAICAIV